MFDIIELKERIFLDKFFKSKPKLYIESIGTIKNNKKNSLVFLSKKKYSLKSVKNKNVIILTDISNTKKSKNIIYTKKPRLIFCKILNYISKKNLVKKKI